MIVLIGKGRRLTLRELQAIAYKNDSTLQWQSQQQSQQQDNNINNNNTTTTAFATDDDNSLLIKALDTLTVGTNDDDSTTTYLSTPETLAFFTILALSIAQGYVIPGNSSSNSSSEIIASKLVNVVIQAKLSNKNIIVPSNFIQKLQSCLTKVVDDTNLVALIPTSILERAIVLATTGLCIIRSLDLSLVSLPIAAMTVDSLGIASTLLSDNNNTSSSLSCYNELSFDVLRPHRSMVTSAATIRALLNDSRYVVQNDDDSTAILLSSASCLRDIPQYHGPATEDIKIAAKRFELEMNSTPASNDIVLDTTIIELIQQQVSYATAVLDRTSTERNQLLLGHHHNEQQQQDVSKLYDQMSLKEIVTTLDVSLTTEATQALSKILDADAKAAEDARQKEAQKVVAAATHAATTTTTTGVVDEFAGMSEAQKTKILKKRAEKEAKLAEKKKAKEQKGVSLFGAGTQPVCQILLASKGVSSTDNNNNNTIVLSIETIQDVVAVQDKLLSGGVQRKPKIPKGTRDYLPEQMMIRQQAFTIIRRVFEAHGAVEIDTPVFELKDTLTGKYGEDSKLIYDLADQGGELLALRYDLTVPFARFLSLNSVGNIKRFHIGKVYRRDQPALKRGRYREFYQCDFDIAGTYGRMVPDSECICVVCDILHNLPIGNFAIKLNHRRLLDAILDICGVPADKFRTICSAVDKLDKEPWIEVKREMVEDKGLNATVADKIGEFVLNNGKPFELHKQLIETKRFGNHKGALDAMEDLRILFDYLDAFDKLKFVSFDLSLARGLDYYTGVIYEAVCMNGNTQVGSIGGGGRYDKLVGMFQDAGKETPCVGVSVGIERVFTLMEEQMMKNRNGTTNNGPIGTNNVSVLIASSHDGMMIDKMRIARMLWDANISAEFNQQDKATLKKELVHVLDRGIPFMIIIGDDELKNDMVVVKQIVKDGSSNKIETKVPIPNLVKFLRTNGVIPVGCEFAMSLLQKEQQEESEE